MFTQNFPTENNLTNKFYSPRKSVHLVVKRGQCEEHMHAERRRVRAEEWSRERKGAVDSETWRKREKEINKKSYKLEWMLRTNCNMCSG